MFNKLKQAIRVLTSGDFISNPNAPQINETDKRALLIGLINSEQLTAYCNSLATGLPQGRILQALTEAWDVNNPDEALSTLNWILDEGHRGTYREILPLLKITDTQKRQDSLLELFNELYQQAVERIDRDEEADRIKGEFEHKLGRAAGLINNLDACINSYGHDAFAAFNDENMGKGILAWDLGRLVTVSRLALDAGYIDEQTAWNYIRKSYQMAIQEYATWNDVAIAYLIGRGAWGGDSPMLGGLYVVAKNSVEDNKSPWRQITLK
jgi:hypothetical protein